MSDMSGSLRDDKIYLEVYDFFFLLKTKKTLHTAYSLNSWVGNPGDQRGLWEMSHTR